LSVLPKDDQTLCQASGLISHAGRSADQLVVKTFFHVPTCTATHVVHDAQTRTAAIIDPVLDFDAAVGRTGCDSADLVVAWVEERGLSVEWLLETHAHADHLSAAPYLRDRLGGRVAIGRGITDVQAVFGALFNENGSFRCDGSQFDRLFDDGDRFAIGSIEAIALHVPGHTPADVAYVIGDAVFCGDTLFMPDSGTARADFPGGDARQLYRSIRRLLALPSTARLFLCHDYKTSVRDHFAWETTVGSQRDANIHVRDGISEDGFVSLRRTRDASLAVPTLMLPSIQVNMRGGVLPPPEANGTRYLKIPLNAL